MATIFRAPIVTSPLQKRPIAAVDYFSRPLTLGINPNAAIRQQFDSAPPRKGQVWIDNYPNLLGTTLKLVVVTLDLPLLAEQLDDSAPRRRYIGEADYYANTLVLGINPNAAIAQLYGNAPYPRAQVRIDVYPNLLGTTLATPAATLAMPQLSVRWDASAPAIRGAVYSQIPPNTLVGQPVPQIQQLEAKEQRKYKVQVATYPNLSGTTLAPAAAVLALPLNAVRWDQGAPPRKRAVTIDQPLHRAVWRDAIPRIRQLDQGAPPPKKPARVSDPPNLQGSTLYVPPAPSTEFYVTVPYLIGDTQTLALDRISRIFCTPSVIGTTGTVTAQSPDAFTLVARGTTITITLGGDENNLQGVRGQVPYNTVGIIRRIH